MIKNKIDVRTIVSKKGNLLEDSFEYTKQSYGEICKAKAGKAVVYAVGNTPILEIYDKTGETSTRFAFLDGQWKDELPEELEFGGEALSISVNEFLELYQQINKVKEVVSIENPVPAKVEVGKAKPVRKRFVSPFSKHSKNIASKGSREAAKKGVVSIK